MSEHARRLHELPTDLTLELGSSGEEVLTLQQYLLRYGYVGGPYSGTESEAAIVAMSVALEMLPGVFDPRTVSALKRAQIQHGLPPTGILDTATLRELTAPRFDPYPDITLSSTPPPTLGATVRYRFTSDPTDPDLPADTARWAVRMGFETWARLERQEFIEVGVAEDAEIAVAWKRGAHGDPYAFDAQRNDNAAHGRYPPPLCDLHFDDARVWTVDEVTAEAGTAIDLITMAAHEIGHCLGIQGHVAQRDALMYQTYKRPKRDPQEASHARLTERDITSYRWLYG